MLKRKAFLFGLNYAKTPSATLQGCINDAHNMAKYLKESHKMHCEVYTDEANPNDTTFAGLMAKLIDISIQSHTENLDFVWLHYSGHGSYVVDKSRDEKDGRDECLVPSDFSTTGVITDDIINAILRRINPKTRVVCVFDCCHSGTIADVKYKWTDERTCTVENIMCGVKAKVITLSGCMDSQVSMDAYDVMGDKKFVGALTACLLSLLTESKAKENNDVFEVLNGLRAKLKEKDFEQVPQLCSTYNLARDRALFM